MKRAAGVCLVLLGFAGCAGEPEVRSYELQGQILGIRADDGEVLVKHGDIEGFMPAMTMPFKVQDDALLEGKKPGDLVTATLQVTDTEGILTTLTTTGHAPLDTSPPPEMMTPLEVLTEGDPVPQEIFFDQDGKARPMASFKGRTVALTFTYTNCPMPNFCPLMDRNFAEVQEAVQASPELGHVQLLSVTIDPAIDTPEVLKAHAATLDADPSVWTFVTGDEANLSRFAALFGVAIVRNENDPIDISHTLRTAVIAPDGTLVKSYSGNAWTPADLIADLKAVPAPVN
ncbi:MAG: hypothetical protein FJW23_07770 [Acidimicrobiia bacterium]|nr:hypothetical protein [Acidimicrobiia bacterium]